MDLRPAERELSSPSICPLQWEAGRTRYAAVCRASSTTNSLSDIGIATDQRESSASAASSIALVAERTAKRTGKIHLKTAPCFHCEFRVLLFSCSLSFIPTPLLTSRY